jgi:signal transduction histidine kinase/ActR/RegA family two-component response regulator
VSVGNNRTGRPTQGRTLALWRERILRAELLTGAGLGTVAYVPSLIISIQSDLWLIVVADTIAWLGILALAFSPTLSYDWRARGVIAIVYVLSVLLIAEVAMPGAGLIWFTAFPVLAAILLGLRAAIVSLATFTFTAAGFAIAIAAGVWQFSAIPVPIGTDLLLWAVNSLNALAVAAALALAMATLLRGLESTNRSLADAIAEQERSQAERERLEAQLRQAHKLEAVGRLAGGIAHDFNNLLVPMLVYTDEVRRELPAGTPAWDRLGEVLQSAERARSLVQRILMFGRRAVVARAPVRLDAIIREAGGLLRAAVPSMIEIRYAFETTEAVVVADPAELHQIIMNLGTNAAYAMRERGGRLVFHLDHVEEGRGVRLRVSDTGRGMDAATVERAFEPFFTTKPASEGSGLGLATVHGIVTGLGGLITLDSVPGRGTTVDVRLPRVMTDADAATAAPSTEPQLALGSGQRVLVVDDEPAVLSACQQLLTRLNYDATACESPEQALELLRLQPAAIDALLTDQAMPGLSGPALAEAARRIRPDLPIVLATGFLDEQARSQVEAIGIDLVLSKPYTLRDLSAALRTVLDTRAGRPVEKKNGPTSA